MLGLFLSQTAAGSLAALTLVPARAAGRGFFRYAVAQSAALMLLALAAGAGRPGQARLLTAVSAGLMAVSTGLFHVGRLRIAKGIMTLSLVPALAGLTRDALALIPDGAAGSTSRLLHAADAWTSALLCGSVLAAMILGHSYLNIPGLSITHLQRLSALFMAAVAARAAVLAASLLEHSGRLGPLLAALVSPEGAALPEGSLDPFVLVLLLIHILFGIAAPAAMSFMAWRTALISSTQSATGILYVALVMVLMGELASRYLLRLTGLPL